MPFDTTEVEKIADDTEPSVRAVIVYDVFNRTDRTVADIIWSKDKTLADYLDGLPDDIEWTIFALGKECPRHEWSTISLVPDDTIVITATPRGGNVGRIMAMVAMVVLTIYAPQIGLAISGAMGIATGATVLGVSVSTLIGAAVVLAGGMLITSLLGTGAPKAPSSSPSEISSSYGLDGAKNTSTEEIPVPVVYGTFRMAGNKTNIFVENSGDGKTQVLYVQYVVAEGEVDSISEVEVDDQPIANFGSAITWDWRPGTQNQTPINWFSSVITPHNVSYILNTSPYIYNTSIPVDKIRVDIVFPQGLYSVNTASGALQGTSVRIYADYRKMRYVGGVWVADESEEWHGFSSGDTWTTITGAGNTGTTTSHAKGVRLTVLYDGASAVPSTEFTAVGTISGSVGGSTISHNYYGGELSWAATNAEPPITATSSTSGTITFVNETGQVNNIPVTRIGSDETFANGTLLRTYETGYLPQGAWTWNFTGGTVVSVEEFTNSGSLTYSYASRNAVRVSTYTPPLVTAAYQVRLARADTESTTTEVSNQATVSDINEISDDVIAYVNTAYYALRIDLGAQINREPKVSALVRGKKLNIYDRVGQITDYRYSDNPADCFLDILLNPKHRFGISPTRIDFISIDNWRQSCILNGLAFNGAFDRETNVWDALVAIARIGRASPVMLGLKYGVVVEAPAEPVMMFTQDSIVKGSFQNEWTGRKGRSNVIEVQYSEPSDHFRQHSVYALDDTFIARGDARIKSTINLMGCTSATQANNEAWLQLNLNRYLSQSVRFDCFIQAIGCVVGDVVLVQHDMPQWGYSAVVSAYNRYTGAMTIDSDIPGAGESDWRVLLLRSAAIFAQGVITDSTGTTVQISGLESPGIVAQDVDYTDLASSTGDIFEPVQPINILGDFTSGGVPARALINGLDYEIVDVRVSGGTVTLVLDRDVAGDNGDLVQCIKTDLLCEGTLAPFTATRNLSITGWINKNGNPMPGDRIMLGRVGKFKKPFRIRAIDYRTDHLRSISAIEYNETVYGTHPEPTPVYSSLSTLPSQISSLRIQQRAALLSGGALQYYVEVTWTRPLADQRRYAGARVYKSVNYTEFVYVGEVLSPNESIRIDTNLGEDIRVRVIAFYENGAIANEARAPIVSHRIAGHTRYPTAISSGTVTIAGGIRQITLRWTRPTDANILSTEVWENTTADANSATRIFDGNVTSYTRTGLDPQVTRYYWLRTLAVSGLAGGFVGPFSATTSTLIAADIADGIINTAKFAAGIKAPYIIASTAIPGTAENDLAVSSADGLLYRWSSSAWVHVVNAEDMMGQITVGQVAAGAIGADEIAANQIRAVHLATSDIIANFLQVQTGWIGTAQIENAAIKTAKIDDLQLTTQKLNDNAVSNVASAVGTATASTPLTTTLSVSGSFYPVIVWGLVTFYVNFPASTSGGESGTGGLTSYNCLVTVKRNGTTIQALSTIVTGSSDSGTVQFHLPFAFVDIPGSGSISYTVDGGTSATASMAVLVMKK